MSYDLYVVRRDIPETSGITGTTLTMTMAATSTTRTISARSSPPIMFARQPTWTARPV